MARGVYGTGRTQMIREHLSRHPNEAFTAREIATAINQVDCISVVGATLATMAGTGKIVRMLGANGRVHYCWPRGMPKPDKPRDRRVPVPRAQAVPKKPRPQRQPAAGKTTPAPKSTMAIAQAISGLALARRTAPPRRVETNFPAPMATVDHSFDPRRTASARIAADIAAFERKGGRIERLGITKIFHHPDDCQD